MRKMFGLVVIGGLIAFVATDANAQRPGGGFGFGGGFFLLQNKGVKEELKITQEQTEKIKTASEKVDTDFPRPKGKDTSKEDREKANKARADATAKAIAEILTPEQAKRLKQIQRQQDVVATLTTDADAVKEFNLSDEQKDKIKAIVEDNRKEMPRLGKDSTKEDREKAVALRKELKEKTLKVLDETQTKKWKEMTGATFEVKFEGFTGKGTPKKKDD